MTVTTEKSGSTAVRPFHVDISDGALEDLRRRICRCGWPSKELVADRSQGVQLATTQELARYWATDHHWRRCEAELNALPQFTTEIDGVDIHFIHVESRHENALPLIMTHGWPGSVIELLDSVGPLTDPTAHGGRAEDAFDLVVPSIPAPPEVSLPVGFTTFPGEVFRAPRTWVGQVYPSLTYFNGVDKGGHFAAWEEPELSRPRSVPPSDRCGSRRGKLRLQPRTVTRTVRECPSSYGYAVSRRIRARKL